MKEWFETQVQLAQDKIREKVEAVTKASVETRPFEALEISAEIPRFTARLAVYETILSMYEEGVSPGRIRDNIIRKMSVLASMSLRGVVGPRHQIENSMKCEAYALALEAIGDNFVSVPSYDVPEGR